MTVEPVLPVIDYTSRDYETIRADLIRLIRERLPQWTATDPNDFGVALVEAVAYTADQLHYYLDRVANEAYLGTALQRESLSAIAQMLGYTPRDSAPANVRVVFGNSSPAAVTLPANSRVQATTQTPDNTTIRTFEIPTEVTIPGNTDLETSKISALAVEGRTYRNELLGVSSGIAYQRMVLPRTSVLTDTVKIFTVLNDVTVEWWPVPRLEDASDEDRAFVLERQTDGSTAVVFGDGINGEIPALHATIFAAYRVGGGALVVPANGIRTLADPVVPTVSVTNPSPSYGGRDAESINSIRINAARSFRGRDRAVTAYDYMAMAKTWGDIAKVKVVANNGVSLVVFVAPENDGSNHPTLTADQAEDLRVYLRSVSMAGVDVTVVDALWIPIHVKMTVHCLSTAKRADVERAVRQVLASLFSFENMDFDERLTVGDINAALFGTKGLAYAVVDGIGVSPQTMSQDPVFFDNIAVHAIPYWDEQNLDLRVAGGT